MPIHNDESHNMIISRYAWTIHEQRLDHTRYSTCLWGGLFVRFPQHDQLASRTAFKALAARRRTARTRRTRGNCLSWTRIGRNKSETYPRLGGKQWPNTFNDVFSMHQMPWEEQLQKNLTNPFAQMIPDLLARSFFSNPDSQLVQPRAGL